MDTKKRKKFFEQKNLSTDDLISLEIGDQTKAFDNIPSLNNSYLDNDESLLFKGSVIKTIFNLSFALISFKNTKEASIAIREGAFYKFVTGLFMTFFSLFPFLIGIFLTLFGGYFMSDSSSSDSLIKLLSIVGTSILGFFIFVLVIPILHYFSAFYYSFSCYIFNKKKSSYRNFLAFNSYWTTTYFIFSFIIQLVSVMMSLAFSEIGYIIGMSLQTIFVISLVINHIRSLKFVANLSLFNAIVIDLFPFAMFITIFVVFFV